MKPRRRFAVIALAAFALCAVAVACSSSGPPTSDAGQDGTLADGGARDSAKHDARGDGTVPDAAGEGGTPTLVALTASTDGEGSTPNQLTPSFSPDVNDYYVRCGAGENAFTVSMTASPGAVSLLTQPITSKAAHMQTLSLMVKEGAAIVAVAQRGSAKTEYWIRCLPHDFPELVWDPHPEAGAPTAGYYLVGNQFLVPNEGAYAMVLSPWGVPLWYLRAGLPGCSTCRIFNVDTVIDGSISFSASPEYEIHNLSTTTTIRLIKENQGEHELRILKNGNYLITAAPITVGVDLSGLFLPLYPDGGGVALAPNMTIQNCSLVEIDHTTLKAVWTWLATDHLVPSAACTVPELAGGTAADGGMVIDTFHCNSIDVDTANNENLLVSARAMDSVFYVDRASGKILWKMGGTPSTIDNATIVSVTPLTDSFRGQHDARLQPSWSSTCAGGHGEISMFDDETGHKSSPARGVVFDVNVQYGDGGGPGGDCGVGADAGANTASVVWERKGDKPSPGQGSFRILADGRRIIGWGGQAPGAPSFSEVDVDGGDLLDLIIDPALGNTTYRAIKVPLTAFDIGVLRHASGVGGM